MTSVERFRSRNVKRMEATKRLNNNFIFKGFSATVISNDECCLGAAVVNKQEKDQVYVYTHIDQPIEIGSVWCAKGLHFLIAEKIHEVYDVSWHKYLGYTCNICIDDVWGYFVGPEKSFIRINSEKDRIIESQQHPVLILPNGLLDFEDKIIIQNRPWLVQEYDTISSPGLVYYSLRPTTVSKEVAEEHQNEETYIERNSRELTAIVVEPVEIEGVQYIGPNVDITLTTEEGYLKYDNRMIKIKKRSATEVVFCLPFGVDAVTISTKEKGEIVTKKYVATE